MSSVDCDWVILDACQNASEWACKWNWCIDQGDNWLAEIRRGSIGMGVNYPTNSLLQLYCSVRREIVNWFWNRRASTDYWLVVGSLLPTDLYLFKSMKTDWHQAVVSWFSWSSIEYIGIIKYLIDSPQMHLMIRNCVTSIGDKRPQKLSNLNNFSLSKYLITQTLPMRVLLLWPILNKHLSVMVTHLCVKCLRLNFITHRRDVSAN